MPAGFGEDPTRGSTPNVAGMPIDSPTLNARLFRRSSLAHHLPYFHAQHMLWIPEIERRRDVHMPGHEVRMDEFAGGGDTLRGRQSGSIFDRQHGGPTFSW